MFKQVLINVEATDIRVAMLEDNALVELFVERFNQQGILGNIYKGTIEAIVPGLKAAFVNIGLEKNAFLHFADVLREYKLPKRGGPERLRPGQAADEKSWEEDDDYIPPQIMPDGEEESEEDGSPPREKAERFSRELHVGDTIMVQVIKEPLGTKGPRVTTFISRPGRYLVMMPFSENSGGVSRKIQNSEERKRLRDLLRSIEPENGAFIIRTAGLQMDEDAIRRDAEAIQKQWKEILRKNMKSKGSALIENEADILYRLVRDTLRDDIDEILIDSKKEMKALIEQCKLMAPNLVSAIHYFDSSKNIFDVFEVEKQFQKALKRKVWLKSGGAIIIDETEALAAIDVNSGKYVGREDQDTVILKTNLEAAKAVSRQLRLRDMGGLIVIDFIDMTNKSHQRQVLQELKTCLNRDNARYSMTGFSEFGLVEMTRKRVRMSLANTVYQICPYCEGTGRILGGAQTWKLIKYGLIDELEKSKDVGGVDIIVNPHMRTYIQAEVLGDIRSLANQFKIRVNIIAKQDYHHEQFSFVKHVKSEGDEKKEGAGGPARPGPQKKVASTAPSPDNLNSQP